MKRSKSVQVSLVGAMALVITACAPKTDKVCVDGGQIVVDSKKCEDDEKQAHSRPGYVPFYHWYYMTRSGSNPGAYPLGAHVSGGSFTAPKSQSVTRGGFGTTGAGRSVTS